MLRSLTRAAAVTTAVFGLAVVVLLATGVAHEFGIAPFNLPFWSWDDGGLIESLGYLAIGASAGMLFVLWLQTRAAVYAAWALIAAALIFDDAARLHELLGVRLASALQLSPLGGLRPDDLGELLYVAVACLAAAALLGAAHVRSRGEHRRFSATMLASVVGIAVLGVVIDAAHAALAPVLIGGDAALVLAIVEEAVEASLMVAVLALTITQVQRLLGPRTDGPEERYPRAERSGDLRPGRSGSVQ